MARGNKSRYAVLGLLTWCPMSGYDIRKTFELSVGNFWSESFGQIYPILRRLVEEKLAVRAVERKKGKPDRHVYSITKKGEAELSAWLAEPAEPHKERIEVLLKLFFGHVATPGDCVGHLRRTRDQHRKQLEEYAAIEKRLATGHAGNPHLPYWMLTVQCGQRVSRAMADWCDETIASFGKRKG